MARKRDQEDVFKPLNDSPATESEEPQGSGRGLEIKIVLALLVLLVAGIGYFAYLKLVPAGDAEQVAAESTSLEIDVDGTVPNQVVPAHVPVGLEPELGPADQTLVMTEFNDVSKSIENEESDAWSAPKAVADPQAQPLDADASQGYAVGYSGTTLPAVPSSTEATFAPMPSAADFSGSSTASMSEDVGNIPSSEPTTLEDSYSAPLAANGSATTMGNGLPTQAAPAALADNSQSMPSFSGSDPTQTAHDLRTASEPAYGASATSLPPATQMPSEPAYTAPGETYAAPAPSYEVASQPDQPSYSAPAQQSYAGSSTGSAPSSAPAASTLPTQDNYRSYAPATSSRTQAGYAGLSGSGLTETGTTPEIWQQPTVVPVDGKYTAQPNDNFYTISRKVYGAGAYFRALAKFNADKYPTASQIRIGDIVQTPPVDTLEGRYPELCPKPEHRDAAKKRSQALAKRSLAGRRIYVVQEGDNLFDIARFELGARARVAELIELNRDVLGNQINYLTPGMRLVLPEAGGSAPKVTQGPTGTLR